MKTRDSERKITFRNLTVFTIVVILSGWAGQALNVLMDNSSEEGLGMLLWLIAPLIATLFLRAFAGDGWYDTGIKPLFRANVKWYLLSLFVFPILTFLGLLIGNIFGWVTFTGFNSSLFLQTFAIALIPNFLKNIPEEFVWRGYLTPKLSSLKINDFSLYLIVGLIWGVWHIPYYLYFLDIDTLQSFTSLNIELFIPLSVITMIAWSIVFVEIWFLTKSIWPVVLMHMVEDAFINPLILDKTIQISSEMELLIHPVVGILGILMYTIVGLKLRKIRLKAHIIR